MRRSASNGPPGQVLARRDGAICIGTIDGAVWISHLKAKDEAQEVISLAQAGIGRELCDAELYPVAGIKLPATQVLGPLLRGVPEAPLPIDAPADHRTFREIVYTEEDEVGYLSFDFYNGAMSTSQCTRLRDAFLHARSRPTRVIVLLGGADFWSNGIHLNAIEASADPAAESWRNINAIDDLIFEILNTMSHLVIAGLRGNAGAGGAMLALAADHVYARSGVVLNPHYRSMGDLYGSEYWTYTLPRRVGQRRALELTLSCKPIGTRAAREMGFLDDAFGEDTGGVRGRAEGAGEAPRPGSGIPLNASEEAREASRRRIRQAPRELSRRGAGTDAGQFLRARPRLSRGPPALRLQGESTAAAEPERRSGQRSRNTMSDRRPEKFWSRWTMTLGVVAVSGAAAVTWTQAEENVIRPEAPGSNAGKSGLPRRNSNLFPRRSASLPGVRLLWFSIIVRLRLSMASTCRHLVFT